MKFWTLFVIHLVLLNRLKYSFCETYADCDQSGEQKVTQQTVCAMSSWKTPNPSAGLDKNRKCCKAMDVICATNKATKTHCKAKPGFDEWAESQVQKTKDEDCALLNVIPSKSLCQPLIVTNTDPLCAKHSYSCDSSEEPSKPKPEESNTKESNERTVRSTDLKNEWKEYLECVSTIFVPDIDLHCAQDLNNRDTKSLEEQCCGLMDFQCGLMKGRRTQCKLKSESGLKDWANRYKQWLRSESDCNSNNRTVNPTKALCEPLLTKQLKSCADHTYYCEAMEQPLPPKTTPNLNPNSTPNSLVSSLPLHLFLVISLIIIL